MDQSIQNTFEQLDESGELEAFLAEEQEGPQVESRTEAESIADTERETTETPETTDTAATTRTVRTPGEEAMVPASEIEYIREMVDMFYRQA